MLGDLSASLLAGVIPAQTINEVLDARGRNTQRLRRFPAVVGVCCTVALSLYPEAANKKVFAATARGSRGQVLSLASILSTTSRAVTMAMT